MEEKKIKVLIIEDEEMLANMYISKFEKNGFEVEKALDGKEGLKIALKIKPDIILLDVIMPKMDGFMVLRELKTNSTTKDIPVIMLTNLGQEEDTEKGSQLGVSDYLVKADLTPSQVVEKVNIILKKQAIN